MCCAAQLQQLKAFALNLLSVETRTALNVRVSRLF